MLKPPLKWAGGKRWLAPHLKPIWEANVERRYVEPFCGGLAVALGQIQEQGLVGVDAPAPEPVAETPPAEEAPDQDAEPASTPDEAQPDQAEGEDTPEETS